MYEHPRRRIIQGRRVAALHDTRACQFCAAGRFRRTSSTEAEKCAELLVAESDVKIRHAVLGYTERRGQADRAVFLPASERLALAGLRARVLHNRGRPRASSRSTRTASLIPRPSTAILREWAFFLSGSPSIARTSTCASGQATTPLGRPARRDAHRRPPRPDVRKPEAQRAPARAWRSRSRSAPGGGDHHVTRKTILAGNDVRVIGDATRVAVRTLVEAVAANERVALTLDPQGSVAERPRVLLPPEPRHVREMRPGWTTSKCTASSSICRTAFLPRGLDRTGRGAQRLVRAG